MLAAALVLALGVLAWLVVAVVQLRDVVERQSDQLQQQDEEIGDLNDLLDQKQEFAAAMSEFLATVRDLEGVPMATLVPYDEAQQLAGHAWTARRSPGAASVSAERVRELTAALRDAEADAQAQRNANATGTLSEGILDDIGRGYARLSLDGADDLCKEDVVGCVTSDDPYVVHLDADNLEHPSMDDWSRRFVTLHEFAHVLQFTNPEATAAAETAFGGDWEFMADCYALRALDAWSLSRRVWVSSFEYWETELGYGRVCDSDQRAVIGDWLGQVGVHARPVAP